MFSEPTSDHTDIFFWAEHHSAVPAEVLSEHDSDADPILSFLFYQPAAYQENIRAITWAEFFAAFEVGDLSFAYEQQPSTSRRFSFGHRDLQLYEDI